MLPMFIDGKQMRSDAGKALEVLNPAPEEVLGRGPAGGEQEVGQAVAAAVAAFPGWRRTPAIFEDGRAGTIWMSDRLTDNCSGLLGGMKMSGLGGELGQEGLVAFQQVKHVHGDMVGRRKPHEYPYAGGGV